MQVGVAREVKGGEYRVALTPAGVTELVRAGHTVLVESGAGEGSSIPDADFAAAGAPLVPAADDVWADADLLLEVQEPVREEYGRLRASQTLFTYLHLAASKECTDALVASVSRMEPGSVAADPALAHGVDVAGREVVLPEVARAHRRTAVPVTEVLS